MGNYSKRTHRETLDEEIAKALLGTPIPGREGLNISAWDRLVLASDELGAAVKVCRKVLGESPLTEITAVAMARKAGRRGEPSISILDDGSVMLEICYGQHEEETADEDDRRRGNSTLPKLSSLRDRAADAGVDPAPFGRRKKDLLDAIEKAEEKGAVSESTPKPVRRKMTRTSTGITPITILNPTPKPEPTPKPVPEKTESPEETEAIKNLIASRRSRPKRSRPVKNLEDVAAIAGRIDMDRILMAEPEPDLPEDE